MFLFYTVASLTLLETVKMSSIFLINWSSIADHLFPKNTTHNARLLAVPRTFHVKKKEKKNFFKACLEISE